MIHFLTRQKFFFDLGGSFMGIVTFCLMSINAAPILGASLDVNPRGIVVVLIPGVLLCVWSFGWLLDRLGFVRAYQHEQNQRNELLKEAVGRNSKP